MPEKEWTVLNWAEAEAVVTLAIRDAGQFCRRNVERLVTLISSRQKSKYAAFKLQTQLSGWTLVEYESRTSLPWDSFEGEACSVLGGLGVVAGAELVAGCARAAEHKTLINTRMGAKRYFIFALQQVKKVYSLVLSSDYTIYHHTYCLRHAKWELLTVLGQLFARVFVALNLYFCSEVRARN